MAGQITTMFGKAYDTVGSVDRNLILQTRGDLKVKWGNKYIDLIKNGKINVDVDLLKKIDSKDSIHKDGLYLIEKEDIPEMLPISNHNANVIYATYGNNENELEIFSWDEETSAYKGIGYLEVNNNG